MPLYPDQALNREEQIGVGAGIKGQNFVVYGSGGGTILTTGTTKGSLMYLKAGEVITNVINLTSVAASGLTSIKVGIYSTAGARLAVSADVQADFEATAGFRINPLTAPYVVPTTGYYYFVILGVGGTQPTVWRGISTTGGGGPIGTDLATAVVEASQTDLDATATFTADTVVTWFGFN